MSSSDDRDLETLLDHLKTDRGVDFTGYKRSSLKRRVLHRMRAAGHDGDFTAYRQQLTACRAS